MTRGGGHGDYPPWSPRPPILSSEPLIEPKNAPPSAVGSQKSKKELDPEIKKWADRIYKTDTKKYDRLVSWIKAAERNYKSTVIAKTLELFMPHVETCTDWWPYLDKILDKEAAKENARNHEKEHEERKRQESATARDLFGGRGLRTDSGD